MQVKNCLSCTFCPETWVAVTKEIGGKYPKLYSNEYFIPNVIEWQNGCKLTYDRNLDAITKYNVSFGYPLVLLKTDKNDIFLESTFQPPMLINNNCKSYTSIKLENITEVNMPPITLRILEKSRYNTYNIPKWLENYHKSKE